MRKSRSAKAKNLLLEGPTRLLERGNRESNSKSAEESNVRSFVISPEGDDNTILIKRTLRSGQSIHFQGNVVVLGDVNPGAEIIASGNIIVMGSLRGVAHAGAEGDERATVTAFKLQPTQLRIANHITRAPDGDHGLPNQPEIARIKDGVVVIDSYLIGQEKQIKIG